MRNEVTARSGRRPGSGRVALAGFATLLAAGLAFPQGAGAATNTISTVAGSDPSAISAATADPPPRLLSTIRPGWRCCPTAAT